MSESTYLARVGGDHRDTCQVYTYAHTHRPALVFDFLTYHAPSSMNSPFYKYLHVVLRSHDIPTHILTRTTVLLPSPPANFVDTVGLEINESINAYGYGAAQTLVCHLSCTTDAQFVPLTAANLIKLGVIKNNDDITLRPDWALICGLLAGVIFMMCG